MKRKKHQFTFSWANPITREEAVESLRDSLTQLLWVDLTAHDTGENPNSPQLYDQTI